MRSSARCRSQRGGSCGSYPPISAWSSRTRPSRKSLIGRSSRPAGARCTTHARTAGLKSRAATGLSLSRNALRFRAIGVTSPTPRPRDTSDRRSSLSSASTAMLNGRCEASNFRFSVSRNPQPSWLITHDSSDSRSRSTVRGIFISRATTKTTGCAPRSSAARSAGGRAAARQIGGRHCTVGETNRGCIELVAADTLELVRRPTGDHPHGQRGKFGAHRIEWCGQACLREKRRQTEPELAADHSVVGHARLEVVQHPEQTPALLVGLMARRRRLQGLREPVQKLRPQYLLEILDTSGHARLGEIETRRRCDNRSGLDHGDESNKVMGVHNKLAYSL